MHNVNKKFKYFVSFLKWNCITNKRDTNTLHKIYLFKNSIIECKLVIYSLNYIVHDVLNIR